MLAATAGGGEALLRVPAPRSRSPTRSVIRSSAAGTLDDNVDPAKIADAVRSVFDLRPAVLVRDLEAARCRQRRSSELPQQHLPPDGHFVGENEGFTWENKDKVDDVKSALGL